MDLGRGRTADVAAPARQEVTLSVVVPAYDEEQSIPKLMERLMPVLESLAFDFEVVVIDDGSSDGTWRAVAASAKQDKRIVGLRLSRNFGKEIALAAGVDAARGQAVVFIDADLQDPPELIPEFVALWRSGYQNVYGLRVDRARDSAFKRLTATLFYGLYNVVSDVPIPPNGGDFRLIGPGVLAAIRACRDRHRFMKGLYAWAGYPSVAVPYERPKRAAGRTKFSTLRLLALALDGIFAHSVVPLRVWIWIVLLCVAGTVVLGIWVLAQFFGSEGTAPPGYHLTVLAVLGFSSLHFIVLGVLGAYIGRIYDEVKDRPLYVVRNDDEMP